MHISKSLVTLSAVATLAWFPAGATAESTAALEPARRALSLRADLSERMLYVRAGDSIAAMYPIGVGTDRHPTPTGTFRISKIIWNPRWVPPDSDWAKNKTAKPPGHPQNPMKVVKIFFREPDYYIHGTGELDSVGTPASHGCLRMLPQDASELGRWLMEHGGNPRPGSWFRRILRLRSQEQVVNLQNPIAISIVR